MNKFELLGKYFGYPECCTKSFIRLPIYERSLVQKSVHKNTGFIPCHECAMKIINKETTLSGLIKNRICPVEFSNGNPNSEQVSEYLAQFKYSKSPGEDIRAAKAIYEDKHGDVLWPDVKEWLRYANEVKEYLGVDTYQEAAEKLNIKIQRIGDY